MKKITLFLFAITMSLFSFAAQPKRIYAYGLSATLEGTMYTFSFSANETPTSGRMLFYDATTSELVGEIALTSPVLGVNNVQISVDELPGIHNQQLNWAVELSAAAVTAYEKIYEDAASKYCRGYSNVDVSPESDHFGSVYVGDRVSTVANSKFYVYSPVYSIVKSDGYGLGAENWGFGRFAIASDGTLWLTDYTDNHSGMFLVNPNDLTTSSQFFAGTRYVSTAPKGVIKNGDIETGSSLACATFYGEGADTKLVTVAEDYKDKSFPVAVFNVGNADGTLKTRWETAPDILFPTGDNAAQNFDIKACEKGVWVAQSRSNNQNLSGAASLCFYAWDGTCTWKSYQHTDIINGSLGGGIAITPDEKQLIMKIEGNTIAIFDIAWNGTTPTLTKTTSFDCKYPVISSINLDYAGNIVTAAGTGSKFAGTSTPFMRLAVYSNPTTNNTCEVPAKKASVVTKKVLHTLTSFSNDEAKGTVSGAGIYVEGTTATLTATPATGYKLLYWSDRSTTNPRTITMNKNEAISAYFVKVYDQEPTFTITKVWQNTNVPTSTGDGFQAVGWDQKIYMQNKTAGQIQVFSNGTDAAANYAASNTSGQQIAVDEAGNLIVFNKSFSTAVATREILIYQKDNKTSKAISFTLPEPGRCDFFSASGDIYSIEGGFVYFYCQNTTVVNRLKIANGEFVSVDVVGNNISSGSSQNHVMVDIFGNLVAHARSNSNLYAINILTNESKSFTIPSHKYGTLGGCSFELGGKELWAYHAGATNYSSEWNIYNMTDGVFLSDDDFYAVDKANSTNNAANWLNVQVVDEYTAYIYQFCPKKAVALWKVTMQAGKATYTVTANATNGSVTGAGTYEEGATATLTATPAEHYRFVNWTKGEEVVSIETTYSFVVTEDVTLTANFEAIPQYAITVETSNADQGSVTGGGTYYEGEEVTIKATAVGGFVFEKWSDNNTDNPRTITVSEAATYTAIFKLAPARVFAYDLDVVDNGNDTYTLSFIPNTNAVSGRVILYNGDTKAQIHEESIAGAIVKGVKSEVVISRSSLPATGNVTWAVELIGEQVEKLTLLTKADDKANYGFNRPQGVAIDNNPASDFFGRIYIALPKAGGTYYTDKNYGIVVMDPLHNRLKSGVVSNGDELGADGRYSMHRVAVNPTNGHVYYVRTSDSNEGVTGTAIYELTPDATNILTDGGTAKNVISGASDITNANSVCFDETGAMYVMANANYDNTLGSTGRVYKVVDGVVTLFTPSSIEIASKDNAIVPDGKGGFWVAQHRNSLDGSNHLFHINTSGATDYYIDQNNNASLLPIQTYTKSGTTYKNASYRGQVAYYSIDENNGLVAYGGGAKVSVFKATYDGSGVPTLESWQTISLLSQSSKEGINVDGIAFDYAGNIIVMSATDERMYQYALPIESANTSLVPSPTSKTIKLGTLYNVEVAVNDNAMGTATGAGEYLEGEKATVEATANADYRFVNWTKGTEVVSTEAAYSFTVTENITLTANFAPLPEIAYELNGGQWNKYGWISKGDMFTAFMTESGATGFETLDYYKAQPDPLGSPNICAKLNNPEVAFANTEKWGWLKDYIKTTQNAQIGAGASELDDTGAGQAWRYAVGSFFAETKRTSWPKSADFTEAGKEVNFQPTWGQSLPNPTQPTTTVVLGNPIRENYLFGGWYAESDFSGVVVTTVDENTDGTLYAKWVEHFYTRNVTNGEYGTICLPYASSNYTGAEFYEVSWLRAEGANAGLYLDEVVAGTILEAGKPYIFRATGDLLTVYYEGDKVDAPVEGVNGLTGTFVEIRDLSSSDPSNILEGNYLIAQNKIWLCETSCVLYPNRAYIKASGLPKTEQALIPGRRRVCMGSSGENTETGTENALTPNVEVIKRIENGQVIIIRDGVKYNVQGQKMQ